MIRHKEFLLETIETIRPILISSLLAIPVGGFIFGVIQAEADSFGGRLLIGLIFALLTSMFAGFPPRNEGGVGKPSMHGLHYCSMDCAGRFLVRISMDKHKTKRNDNRQEH